MFLMILLIVCPQPMREILGEENLIKKNISFYD